VKRRPQGKGEYTTVYTGKTVPEEYESSYNGYCSTSQSVMRTFNAINEGRQL
jgi:hypothetical protein